MCVDVYTSHTSNGWSPRHAAQQYAYARDRTSKHERAPIAAENLARRGRLAERHGSAARLAEGELDLVSVSPEQKRWDVVRDGIRVGQGVKRGMRGKVFAGFGGEAEAHLGHQHAHDVSSAKTMSSHRSAGGRRWALGVGRRHRQRGGTGRRSGQRGHGRVDARARAEERGSSS